MVQDMVKKMVWLGHDAFRIDADKTIYFDPYQISTGPGADLILISHDHFDHCSPEDVAKIQKSDTVIETEKDSAKKLSGDVRVIKAGDTISVGDVKIEAVPSYNTDKDFHPQANAWVGFIIEVQGVRVYHAGDTDFIPEMKDFNVDIALLPVSGVYVMNAEQAIQAALAINPKIAIPMHYGAVAGTEEDAVNFKKALEGKVEVVVMQQTT